MRSLAIKCKTTQDSHYVVVHSGASPAIFPTLRPLCRHDRLDLVLATVLVSNDDVASPGHDLAVVTLDEVPGGRPEHSIECPAAVDRPFTAAKVGTR